MKTFNENVLIKDCRVSVLSLSQRQELTVHHEEQYCYNRVEQLVGRSSKSCWQDELDRCFVGGPWSIRITLGQRMAGP